MGSRQTGGPASCPPWRQGPRGEGEAAAGILRALGQAGVVAGGILPWPFLPRREELQVHLQLLRRYLPSFATGIPQEIPFLPPLPVLDLVLEEDPTFAQLGGICISFECFPSWCGYWNSSDAYAGLLTPSCVPSGKWLVGLSVAGWAPGKDKPRGRLTWVPMSGAQLSNPTTQGG